MNILRAFARHVVLFACLFVISSDLLAFTGPLETPSRKMDNVEATPMAAVTAVGSKLVAVGQRGKIILSHDGGESWIQAEVPVSSDLVAVSFASDLLGWAVGHDGVILHTGDGGLTWELQLDGHEASAMIVDFYKARVDDEQYPDAELYLRREEILLSYGGTQPLMDVYFEDGNNGYAVGIFNRLLRTTDGGETWKPWAHRIDNPGELHLYSINAGESGVYISGEQGQVWRLNEHGDHFVEVPTPYTGTLFGSVNTDSALVVFGMRGTIYRSVDRGNSWEEVNTWSEAGITDGMVMADGRIVLANLAGELLVSVDNGKTFSLQSVDDGMPFYGLAAMGEQSLVLTGAEGVHQQQFTPVADETVGNSRLMVNFNHIVNLPPESPNAIQ